MLSDEQRIGLSKLMAFLLRHDPNLPREKNGWVQLDVLLKTIKQRRANVELEDIIETIEKDPKGRYEVADGKVRAKYGHSVDVILELPEGEKNVLFHGTAPDTVKKILREGIQPMGRKMVHLSATIEEAIEVGKRRTHSPAILKIDVRRVKAQGIKVLKASEKVYLAESIPPECIMGVEVK